MNADKFSKLLLVVILFFTWCSRPKIESRPVASESRDMKEAISPNNTGETRKTIAEPDSGRSEENIFLLNGGKSVWFSNVECK